VISPIFLPSVSGEYCVVKVLEAKIRAEEIPSRLSKSRILNPIVRGLLWINPQDGTYRVDEVGRILLSAPAKQGNLADIASILNVETYSKGGSKALGSVAFASPSGRFLRMKQLTRVGKELLSIVEDMTEIVVGENEMMDREAAYRGLFENTPVGIFRSIPGGGHIHANPAMVAMMGCSTEAEWLEYSRKSISGLYVEQGRRERMYDIIMSEGRVVDFQNEIYKVTGEKFWMSVTAWLVRDENGAPLFVDGTMMDISERVRSFTTMKKAAETDELTGLYNRTRLYELIEEKTTKEIECAPIAVMLLDLDRFKDINDVFGHATGDSVLLEVSNRLKNIVGEKGLVARLGGDEFAAVVEDASENRNAEAIAQQIVEAMREPIRVKDIEHALSVSIGIACYPDHALGRAELLRKADIALYNVKSRGRNGLCKFTAALEMSRQRTHYLAQELRDADKRGELELHYQPIVEAGEGKVQGFEALMRWNHPVRGRVSPMEFIPIAEDSGYMPAFGGWAIREACAHIVTLPSDIYVSVNVSAVQFNAVEFPSIVEAALNQTGLAPSRLELEVTEGIVLRNEERTIEILDKLKKIGVRIALDDFGTGYSSFGYLQKFPFDKVKIDRSFVKNLAENKTNVALVRAVLSIGRDLGLPVVAEGVETADQRDRLREEGCPLFQGYFYGKPAPFSDVASSIALDSLKSVVIQPIEDLALKSA
jgi:diguanylate cyclase (GGDEF)-like protein/PAS domain S-box-containing protein